MLSASQTRALNRAVAIIAVAFVVASSSGKSEDGRTREKSDELIHLTNLDRDTVAGQWRKTSDGLMTSAATGSRIALPVEPTGEYDFKVTFTRQTGQHSIVLMFVLGTSQAAFDVDAWGQHLAGFQNVGGKDARQNSTRAENVALVNGRKYAVELRVRLDRVEAFLDGKLLSTYRGDGSDLSILETWRLP